MWVGMNKLQINNFKNSYNTGFSSQKTHHEKVSDAEGNKKHLPYVLTGAALAGVAGTVVISKGHKNNQQILNKIKNILEEKLENSPKKAYFYEYSIRKVNSFIEKSQSINNITSLKDILFKKFMSLTEPTKKVHSSITNLFEKISLKTIKKSYKKTDKNFNKVFSAFDKLDETILKNPNTSINYKGEICSAQELINKTRNYRENTELIVKSFISEKSQEKRYNVIKSSTSDLCKRFWDVSFKDFFSKNNKFKNKQMYQSFIAADQVHSDKTKLGETVAIVRYAISYANKDKTKMISGYVKNLNNIIAPNDKESIQVIKKLNWFLKNPKDFEANKDIFLKELYKLKHTASTTICTGEAAENFDKYKQTYIKMITELLINDTTGELQDMLDIYHRLAPVELSKTKAENMLKKAVKSFDKSVKLETEDMFDKVRDLELGSAPTDVLTILTSTGLLGYGLAKAKNKEERKSIVLKAGIPILGAISVSLGSAARLVSGGKALALGLISGLVLNKIGTGVDNIYKKKQTNLNQKS